jgi:hypothetical protein
MKNENGQDQLPIGVALAVQHIPKPAFVRPVHGALEIRVRLHCRVDAGIQVLNTRPSGCTKG